MLSKPVATELREQGRGVVGALLVVGVSTIYTVEIWWAGWQLSSLHLIAYALVGLTVVLAITRNVGFRSGNRGDGQQQSKASERDGADEAGSGSGEGRGERDASADEEIEGRQATGWEVVTDFFEVVVQSFVAAYVFFLLFGVIDLGDPVAVVARLGLVGVVPLGFGASLANQVLTSGEGRSPSFATHLAVVGLGAVFFATPIAPTEEVPILAANAGWLRLGAVVLATLVVTQLTLYELEFRGQRQRLEDTGTLAQWAQTAVVYTVACAVAFGLLAMFGRPEGGAVVWLQEVVVLGFPASIGGSAARVVL